jgi:hypothetical protein
MGLAGQIDWSIIKVLGRLLHTVKKRCSRKLCYSSVVQIARNLLLSVT